MKKARSFTDDNNTVEGKPFAVEFFEEDKYTHKISDKTHCEYYSKFCDAIKSANRFNKIMKILN